MNRVSRKRGRLFVWLIRLLLPLIIFLGSLEIYVRHFVYDSIYRDNDCIYYKKKEEDARKPHRFFKSNCRVSIEWNGGKNFEIFTNEDGLRDRSREEFRDGAVAILGDSHVEGFAFPIEQSIGRRIEALAGSSLGGKVLNLGFRGSGPSEQLRILDWIRPHYKIVGAVWILTENDILDEFYYNRLDQGGRITWLSQTLTVISEKFFARRWYTFEWLRIVTHSLAKIQSVKAGYDGAALSKRFCRVITSIRQRLPANAPVHVIGIPHGRPADGLPYFGAQLDKASFWNALECARAAGVPVIDQREFYSSLYTHYLPDRYHLDAEGTERWARRILQDMGVSH